MPNPFTKAAKAAKTKGETGLAQRITTEGRIVGKLIDHALKAGYKISVYDGEKWVLSGSRTKPKILGAMFSTDGDSLRFRDAATNVRIGTVDLVYGNDHEVISDYAATDLDAFSAWMEPIAEYAETFS